MELLATEFPVSDSATRAGFVAHVTKWLKGTRYSKLFGQGIEFETGSDNSVVRVETGEELSIREISNDDGTLVAIGFRHDNPDNSGRLWRTEGVLRFGETEGQAALVRLRTVCTAKVPGAYIELPKKPFLIKALLQDAWGGRDGLFEVADKPHYLNANQEGLDVASAVVAGTASCWLPIVYVSAKSQSTYELDPDDIERLAYQLGGFAHVIVEPDRQFSFNLKAIVRGRNAYGGTIGIYAPGQGAIARIYRSADLPTQLLLHERVRHLTMASRTRMPSAGLDWSELQEFALRKSRIAKGDQSDFAELEGLYLDEIAALKEQIESKDATIHALNEQLQIDDDNQPEIEFVEKIERAIGAEIYRGEILDRIRLAGNLAMSCRDREGLDDRTMEVFKAIFSSTQVSRGYREIANEIRNNLKDNSTLCETATRLLQQHGFDKLSMNEHAKLTPAVHILGLGPITVPRTPSDHRAGSNLQSTIRKELGLTKLDF